MMTTHSHQAPDAAPEREIEASALPPLSRNGWLAVAAGIAALVGVAVWVGLALADQPVRWKDVGFDNSSATEASVTYDVYLYSDQPVTCHLRALNERFAEVGIAQQVADPSDGAQQRFTTTMATTEQATTVVVRYCAP
jgi:hypothetical protein